jgi:acyl-CoA synthetase (AMP-forming)/AMP-acid ligase II
VVVPADPSNPPTLEDLVAHGRSDLAAYKLPEALQIVESLPLNSGDKLDRRRMTADMRGD